MADINRKILNWLPWLVSGIVTLFVFYDVLLHPGSRMLSIDGDASKNYFTFLYHSMYGQGFWFDGMNYPYGDHIVFTDAIPAFAIPFSVIYNILPVTPLAVIHLLLIAGFYMAIIYVYKILQRMQVHTWWAIVGAVLIVVMSPQQFKFAGHFSLAFFCVIPVVFYYNLAWYQTNQRKHILALFAAALLFTFIHLYFSMMIAMWAALYSIGYFFFHREKLKNKLRQTLPVLFAGIAPLFLFRIFMLLTDTVTDRPAYPYGARAHGTTLGDIVTSYLSPISKWLAQWTNIDTLSGGNEGYAYIGFAPLLIFLVALAYVIVKLLQKKIKPLFASDNNGSIIWLFIAFSVLVFSSAIIFKKCFTCLDYASFIRQFRAIGRFSWVFYYIVTILSVVIAYGLYCKLTSNGKNTIAYLLAAVLLLISVAEALPYAGMTRTRVAESEVNYKYFYRTNTKDWAKLLSTKGYTADSFRALYVLPYFHVGTEKLGLSPRSYSLANMAFSTSLQLHLPLMNVMMSRNSWQQAFAQVRVSGGPYTNKMVLQSRDYRPILLVHPANEQLNPDEQYLLTSSQFLGSLDGNNICLAYR